MGISLKNILLIAIPTHNNSRCVYIYMFFAFFGYENFRNFIFLAQAFANLHGKRRQGKFIWKTRIYMLQTCKHETAKLIFQKVLIFWFNNFFFYLQIFKLLSLISASIFIVWIFNSINIHQYWSTQSPFKCSLCEYCTVPKMQKWAKAT